MSILINCFIDYRQKLLDYGSGDCNERSDPSTLYINTKLQKMKAKEQHCYVKDI
jgi:hypothetical protein